MNKEKITDIINTEYNDSDNVPLITEEEEEIIRGLYDKIKSKELEQEQNFKEEQETIHYHNDAWVQTYTGKKVYPLNPKSEDIDINDIAHSLSMICRFTGHVKNFYSVANHSILTSYVCNQEDRLSALLHDCSEFLLTDLCRPLKQSGGFDNYLAYEKTLQSIIYRKFGLKEETPPSVKKADNVLLATEARDLMTTLLPGWNFSEKPLPFKIIPMTQPEAEKLFLERFYELTDK